MFGLGMVWPKQPGLPRNALGNAIPRYKYNIAASHSRCAQPVLLRAALSVVIRLTQNLNIRCMTNADMHRTRLANTS